MPFFQPQSPDNLDVCLHPDFTTRGPGLHGSQVSVVNITQELSGEDTPLAGSPLANLAVTTQAVWSMEVIAQARKGYIPVVQAL